MSYLPENKIKRGFWINHSHGQVLGSTITTDTTTANVIVSILAIVVSLGSIHLWHFILFSFYQIRARNKDTGDGLFRQQQALFRSFTSPTQTLWDFTKLGWTWRGKTQNAVLRSLGPILLALIFSLGALATSLASSFIIETSAITVLVDSQDCGLPLTAREYQNNLNQVLSSAQDYALNCYVKDITSGLCIKFVQPKLNFTTVSVPCPFSESVCIGSEENPAITLDTGYLDSNNDFGLNASPEDRVQIRKKTTCAPIKVSGYYETVDYPGPHDSYTPPIFPGEQAFLLLYGKTPGGGGKFNDHEIYDTYLSNLTYAYAVMTSANGPTYGPEYSSYFPKKEFLRSDADVIFVWIFPNAVQYEYQVDDPVFSAHKKGRASIVYGGSDRHLTIYYPDNPLGTVACTEQYQFCITDSNGLNCTDLGGIPTPHDRDALGSNENQLVTFDRLYASMFAIDTSIIGVSKTPLISSDRLSTTGIQGKLPDDQWKHEVKYWESLILSTIQTLVAGQAIGPELSIANDSNAQIQRPTTAAGKRLCKAQKMTVQGGFANISVFGLAFTISVSVAVVIADLLLLKVLVLLRRFYKFWGFNIDSWIQDGVLQLQRKAYEGSGQGKWSNRNKEIPLAGRDDALNNFESEQEESREGEIEGQSSDSWCSSSTREKVVGSDSGSLKNSTPAEDIEATVQHS